MKVVNVAAIPASDSAGGETGLGMGDHPGLIKVLGDPKPIAAVACTRRVIE